MKLKKFGFIYLISYLVFGGLGLSLLPALTLQLFLASGDYGTIMPRVAGILMLLLSYVLYNIFQRGYWAEFSPITLKARIPLILFVFYLYYISNYDPLFIVLNAIIIPGVIITAIGMFQNNTASR